MKNTASFHINDLIARYPALAVCQDAIKKAAEMITETYRGGGKVMVCGNGGSAADSLHIAGELAKSFVLPHTMPERLKNSLRAACPEIAEYCINNLEYALPAISLVSETALSTAYANDRAPDLCFAQQVFVQGKKGDTLIGITTSGNSANVVYAAGVAKAAGIRTIGLTGENGGKLSAYCDALIAVPEHITFKIQEYHLPVYHAICLAVETEFFGN